MVSYCNFQRSVLPLNVIPIAIPPLRERRDDIQELVDPFVKKHAQAHRRRLTGRR